MRPSPNFGPLLPRKISRVSDQMTNPPVIAKQIAVAWLISATNARARLPAAQGATAPEAPCARPQVYEL